MMLIDNKFNIGDLVYLKSDREQYQRIITRIVVTKFGLTYGLSVGSVESFHYDFEISTEKAIAQ